MPRGKAWTRAESIALVEAFIHISEDEVVGANQRSETLYARVVAESKSRYAGDWIRNGNACKNRWGLVSREVLKFIAHELLVQSVAKSGWGEDDYYKAAVKAYFAAQPNFDLGKLENEELLVFEFKEEWEILRDHEKWRTTLTNSEKKRKVGAALSGAENSSPEMEVLEKGGSRPSGQKKAKLVLSLSERTDSLLLELTEQKNAVVADRKNAVVDLLEKMSEASSNNLEKLERIVSNSTRELTQTINMKLLMQTDLSTMTPAFQKKAKDAIQKHFEATVLVAMGVPVEEKKRGVDVELSGDSSNEESESDDSN
jgi:No apical meristem-associated C-terminal domain